MDMQLVINTGSTSKKYALYKNNVAVFTVRFEEVGKDFSMTATTENGKSTESISRNVYETSLEHMINAAKSDGVLNNVDEIKRVGIRIVAPGTYFTEHRSIDDEYLRKLENMQPYAPLHVIPVLHEVKETKKLLGSTGLFGISDSAFHKTIPEEVRRYSIRDEDTEQYDIKRFGYHGLSVDSVVQKLKHTSDIQDMSRVIVCHIGGGVSITAVKDGRSIDTSMGFSPVGGLHMGTRTGDIDPGAVIYLAQKKDFSYKDVREYFNKEGGMKGVTGGISDMRILLDQYQKGDEKAVLAIGMFLHRIKKYIGGYIATLGGLDVLVLTAAVSERNPFARALICSDLEHLYIKLDTEKNDALQPGEDGLIGVDGSSVQVAVIQTNEMDEIAQTLTNMDT